MHGQFIWYELTSPDPSASKKFYPKFTDWGTMPFDKDYTMWTTGGTPHAGLFTLNDEMRAQGVPPNWMGYVEANDVDESAALATSLGATVVLGPQDIPGTGRFAVVQDPQGVMFGLYKSSQGTTGWDGTPVVGRFSWHELMTPDHEKAFEFYRKLFGWEKLSEMDMGNEGMYLIFGKGKAMYGGMFSMKGEFAGMHPFWLYYVHVKDVPKAVATAKKAGGTLHRGPMDIPGGVIAIMGDPQGAGFALHHVTAAAPTVADVKAMAKQSSAKKATKKKVAAKKKSVKQKPAPRKAAKKVAKKAARKVAKKAAKKVAKKTSKKKTVKRSTPKRGAKRRSAKRK